LLTIPYDLVFVHDTISKKLLVVVVSPKEFDISSMIPIVSMAKIREREREREKEREKGREREKEKTILSLHIHIKISIFVSLISSININ
jgi:hypothetical protein